MMTKRLALLAILSCTLAIALVYASAFMPGGAPRAASWLMAIATSGLIAAVLMLGAARAIGIRNRWIRVTLVFTFLALAGGFCLALLVPPVTAESRLWLGLPHGAAIIIYVVGLLPLLVLPIVYALTFDEDDGS